jgi:hypothetical protein
MVVKNGKAPARRKSASSSSVKARSNTVSKGGKRSGDSKETDQLDGIVDLAQATALESEAGDRMVEATGIAERVSGRDLSPEPIELTAITLHQPWASLIAAGKKHYETRSWSTDYRGPIAIHAGKKFEQDESLINLLEISATEVPLGAVVAIAEMTDCILMTEEFISQQTETELRCGDWKVDRYAFKFENVRAIESIQAVGKQGLWKFSWSPAESIQLKVGDRLTNGTEFATISIITRKDVYLKRESGGSICLPASELKSFGWEPSNSWNPADFGEAEYKSEADGQLNFLEVNEPPEPDDYDSIELFDEAYKQWEDSQQLTVNSQQTNSSDELCNQSTDGSICAAELVQDSPMPESNCGSDRPITSVSGTATAAESLPQDSLESTELMTSKNVTSTSAAKYSSSLLARLANPLAKMEIEPEPMTAEIAFPTCLEQSESYSQTSQLSKTSLACLTAPIPPVTNQEAILDSSSMPYPRAGTMQNGKLSAALTLPALGVEKGSLLLRSPGGLSSGENSRPPGKSRLENQLHQLGLIQDGEVVAPEFLESGYSLPAGWTNLQESRSAIELAQQLPIGLKSELLAEMETTAIAVKPLVMPLTGELQRSDSSELIISLNLPANIGVLTKAELISMAQEQHQLICIIERKEFELAVEKLHRVRLTGVYLQEFKKKCQYGEFENQLEQAGIGVRSAQNYMVIAKNWEIVEAKTHLVALLTEDNQPSIGLNWALEAVKNEKKSLKSAAPPKDPDSWRTPNTREQPIVDLVKQALGGNIWLDPCSDSSAKVPASVRYFKADDGLAEHQTWSKTVFVNPPFSDPSPWVEKCCFSIARGNVSAAIMLLKAGTVSNVGTGELISKYASAVCHWRGRIDFLNDEGNPVKGSDFDCILVYFGDQLDLFRQAFSGRGTISTIENHFSSVNKKYLQQPATVAVEQKQLAAAVGLSNGNGRSVLPDMRDVDRDLMERYDPHTVFDAMPQISKNLFEPIEQPEIFDETPLMIQLGQAKENCLNDYVTAISSNLNQFSNEQILFLAKIINEESAKRIGF